MSLRFGLGEDYCFQRLIGFLTILRSVLGVDRSVGIATTGIQSKI